MCRKIKQKIGYFNIARIRRKQRRKRQVFNLKTGRTIGIVFDATDPKDFDTILEFHMDLLKRGRKVTVLGFVNAKEIPPHYLFRKDFIFFSKKMLNWYGRPLEEDVIKFIKYPFDILIDLSLKDHFVFDYIRGTSPARFKVSRYREGDNYADMMLSLEENDTLEYFIEVVTNYLEMINRPELASIY